MYNAHASAIGLRAYFKTLIDLLIYLVLHCTDKALLGRNSYLQLHFRNLQ